MNSSPLRATSTALVPASVDQVWKVLADHEGMAAWAPGLRVSVTTPGAPERDGVGAVRRIKAPGPAPAIVEEVVAFEPGRRLGYRAISGVPLRNYGGEVVLSATTGGTEIAYTIIADQRLPVVERLAITAISKVLLTALKRQVKATA